MFVPCFFLCPKINNKLFSNFVAFVCVMIMCGWLTCWKCFMFSRLAQHQRVSYLNLPYGPGCCWVKQTSPKQADVIVVMRTILDLKMQWKICIYNHIYICIYVFFMYIFLYIHVEIHRIHTCIYIYICMIYRLQYSLVFQKHTEKVFEGSRKLIGSLRMGLIRD